MDKVHGYQDRSRVTATWRRAIVVVLTMGLALTSLMVLSAPTQAASTISEYALPASSRPFAIATGSDGAVWFTEPGINKIGRITTTGAVTHYNIPTAASEPAGIAAGPDGSLWFLEYDGNKVGRCTTSGHITEYNIPSAGSHPWGITQGPDGNMWFTEPTVSKVGKITMGGHITEYAIPDLALGITLGPDGNIWMVEPDLNRICKMTVTTPPTITQYNIPTAASGSTWICRSGNLLYFSETNASKIGFCDTSGNMWEKALPHSSSGPFGITAGNDGDVWFTERDGNRVGRFWGFENPIREYSTPTGASSPMGICQGPDASVWFTESSANKIARKPLTYYRWYLPEGSEDWGFTTYLTLQNPNPTPVVAWLGLQLPDGNIPYGGTRVDIAPFGQTTFDPRVIIGNRDFSTIVVGDPDLSIAVDRTMIWQGPGAPSQESHSSIGVNQPATTWYLPEGSSKWGFECWLLIQNPQNDEAHCQITYMIEGAAPVTVTKTVGGTARATFNIADDIGAQDASIRVVSDIPVIPERAMYRYNRREGHDSIGATSPANDFYLAEGTTAYGFTTYVLVQNPNDTACDVTVTYMTPSGDRPQPVFTMPPNSRETIRVNDVLPGTDCSTKVHGSKPILAERAMYWGQGSALGEACHDSIGLSTPHFTFCLPDGDTGGGHETFVLVQNPNPSPAQVQVTYMTVTGTGNVSFTDTIPANSRRTYNMADRLPGVRAATRVTCTNNKKIMVERSMYWNGRGAGTDTIGCASD